MSFRTTTHNQYLETGGITVYDNEEFNLVLTGVDLHRIKAIKFTTVVVIIITVIIITSHHNHHHHQSS